VRHGLISFRTVLGFLLRVPFVVRKDCQTWKGFNPRTDSHPLDAHFTCEAQACRHGDGSCSSTQYLQYQEIQNYTHCNFNQWLEKGSVVPRRRWQTHVRTRIMRFYSENPRLKGYHRNRQRLIEGIPRPSILRVSASSK
jgi:hypothetical protein